MRSPSRSKSSNCPRWMAQPNTPMMASTSTADSGISNHRISKMSYRATRSAFSTTSSELQAMPSPAAQGGSQPSKAMGMQARL